MDDERFSHIARDARFKKIPNRKRKVKIDSRFQQMFTDKNFNTKYFVDKRGRKVKDSANEDLTHFYNLSDQDDEVVEEAEINKTQSKKRGNNVETLEKDKGRKREKSKKGRAKVKEGNKSYEEKEIMLSDVEKEIMLSDEEKEIMLSDEEKEIMLSDEETGFHNKQTGNEIESWHELEGNVTVVEDATSRLALCNMDWDKITADDLFVLFHSFLPSGGIIYSIKIYPSDYGLERMKREDEIGPTELVSVGNVSDEDMQDKDNDYNQERLRQYQLNRLRYYYAVVQCNSPVTAETIYEECDGMEYETSSSHLDLRFIPDDMVFEHKPTSLATALPSAETYKPSEFITTALQQSTVRLTWDETDPKRVQTTMRNFSKDDLLDMDFKAYLASSSGEEESEGEDENKKEDQDLKIAKYKVLLEELQRKEGSESENEMKVTWEVGLKETTEELVKRKKNEKQQDQLTPWENYLIEKKNQKRKRRQHKENESKRLAQVDNEEIPADVDLNDPFFAEELEKTESNLKEKSGGNKKKRKRGSEQRETEEDKRNMAELQLLLMEDDEGKKHFNLKSIMKDERKKKMKNKREETQKDDFKIDLNDRRFSALYSCHHYAVDPSDPQFKRTKAMDSIIKEKQRRSDSINKNDLKNQDDKATVEVDTLDTTVKNNTVNPSLSSLIKNIKSNASKFQNRRNKNVRKIVQ